MLWYGLGRPAITDLKKGNWSLFVLFKWRFVFGIIMRWEGREPFLSPFRRSPPDAITTPGLINAAALLRLSFAKVSNTKDVPNRQTRQEILCVFT